MFSTNFRLIEAEWPDFGVASPPAPISLQEIDSRLAMARSAMAARGLTHLVVYGDREHFANLAYLTGFDPRFEESLLVLQSDREPLLIVGNECEGYLPVSPLFRAGRLRHERFQPFSLLDQPRDSSRYLRDILGDEGICSGANVGAVGWKYFAASEHPQGQHTLDLPAYIADTLRDLAGWSNVVNATDLLMSPAHGLRATCSSDEIAYFEFTNTIAADGMRRMIFGLEDGIRDYDLAMLAEFNGLPLGCHMTMVSGENADCGLSSPVGATIRRGDLLATNISYWGSNICRAGWVAETHRDLPLEARDYVESFAGPYFQVMAEWFALLRVGTPGGELARLIQAKLPYETFGIFLNAGHLIHLDEWLSSPIYPGSQVPLRSGMVMQVDVIPSSPTYGSTRMEDGVVIADAELRKALATRHPACYARCQARRAFMQDVLGIPLPDDVLPLSNIPGIVPPFFLAPNLVLALG